MMVKKVIYENNTKKAVLTILAIMAIYIAIHYLRLEEYATYGILIGISWLASSFSDSSNQLSLSLTYLGQLISVLAPGVIIGFLLTILKQQHAFRLGFATTLIAYFIVKIAEILLSMSFVNEFVIQSLAILLACTIALLLVKRVMKPSIIWPIIIGVALINVFAIPHITNAISKPIVENKQANELSEATAKMKFTAYYPNYIPDSLNVSEVKLEGYHNPQYQHQRVSYEVGKLEFVISEKLKNQEQVFNKTDNCDISAIWFEMRSKSEISQTMVNRSRDNLAICRMLGKTNDGHEVYIEANKSQFEFYYEEIDGTIIVMQHDTSPRPRYADDFEKEVLKVFNSMKALNSSRLTAGY